MDVEDAARLVAPAVERGRTWADLGAGGGTFTQALSSLLGPSGRVCAVERDGALVRQLQTLASRRDPSLAPIEVIHADFTTPLTLPPLDGALLANALHFVPAGEQVRVLRDVASQLAEGGVLLIIEYEDRPASRWVPYPIPASRLRSIARDASLGDVRNIGSRPSEYGGSMYAAVIASPLGVRT